MSREGVAHHTVALEEAHQQEIRSEIVDWLADDHFEHKAIPVTDPEGEPTTIVIGHASPGPGYEGGPQIILSEQLTDHPLRKFEIGRAVAIARLTGGDVYTIGNPRIGRYSGPLTQMQKHELTRNEGRRQTGEGDPDSWYEVPRDPHSTFNAVGFTQAKALEAFFGGRGNFDKAMRGKILVLMGSSIGPSFGAGMMRSMTRKPDVVIFEEVTDHLEPVSLPKLAIPYLLHGGDDFPEWRDTHEGILDGRPDSIPRGTGRMVLNLATNLTYARGNAGGSLLPDLKHASDPEDLIRPQFFIVGGDGKVFPPERREKLVGILAGESTHTVHDLWVPGGEHPMYNDPRLQAAIINHAVQTRLSEL